MRFISTALAAASTLFVAASAQGNFCQVPGEFCIRVGVPQASAQSGSGNIYFQIATTEAYQWAGFGTGSRMSGSYMFLMYSDGSGNVTLSPRKGSGHSQPQASSEAAVELLEGSGVSNGLMTANFVCSNCMSLFDPTGSNTMIVAYKSGSGLEDASASASISQHDDYGTFTMDFSQAQVASDSNPFVTSNGQTDGTNSNGNSNGNGNGGANSNPLAGSNSGTTTKKSTVDLVLLHGVIMTVAFVFMYPVGAILMPLVGKWIVHAGWQMVAFVAMWAGFGIGYNRAQTGDILFQESHTILGTIVCVAMVVQPVIGYLHHMYYKKHQTRGIVSYAHIWYGRLIMFLGILNGGIGLKWANASNSFVIAYSVIAALVGVAYIASSYVGEMRRARQQKAGFAPKEQYRPTYSAGGEPTRGGYSPVNPTFGQQAQRPQQGGFYNQPQNQTQYGNYR